MTSALKAIGAGAIAAKVGKTLLEWGKDAIAAASDLEEVQNVVDVTFGDSANQINAWAKTAIQQFGLTETKAKQFASTMGAAMKSASMSGPEIVEMSENLSGLAADMASFYNLDFDTAFQKIRSGISGETEPLKQLGINMSVANLNAFALQQGLTKTFDKMSQGEQTMLRYQYLMQATADAQGDFARTSDGYANGLRLLESNIESIKTTLGQGLVHVLAGVTSQINDFLTSLQTSKPRTVLDEFADINLKTEEKLAAIEKTATEANALIGTLNDISDKVSKADTVSGLVSFVNSFAGSVTDLTGALAAAKDGDVKGTIKALADQLAADVGGDPAQWETLLTAISANLPGATAAALIDGEKTPDWLAAAAAAADDLGEDYSGLWDKLLEVLGDKAGDAISALATASNPGSIMEGIAKGANVLGANSPKLWSDLLTALKKVDGLQNLFSDTSAAGNVASLAEALSGNAPDTSKAEAWKTFLSALSDNADAFSTLTKTSPEETKKWLSEIAAGANELAPENAEGWNKLLQNFITGMPGLNDSEAGKAFFDAMAQNFLSMGNESEQAKAGLAALGLSTEQITDKQNVWLETCKRLVETIPGLSDLINAQTGEVKGGVSAIEAYVRAWRTGQMQIAYSTALQDKRNALAQAMADMAKIQIDLDINTPSYNEVMRNIERLKQAAIDAGAEFDEDGFLIGVGPEESAQNALDNLQSYIDAHSDVIDKQKELTASLQTSMTAIDKASDEMEKAEEICNKYGGALNTASDSADDAAESMTKLQQAASDEQAFAQLQQDIKSYEDALKALTDYTEKAYQSNVKNVQSTLNGFAAMVTPAEAAIAKVTDLEVKLSTATEKEKGKLNETLLSLKNDANEAVPTIENMTKALQSQIDHLQAYYDNLAKIKAGGFSADVLAMVSGGTAQDMDYAKALADEIDKHGANSAQVKKLNDQVKEVKAQTDKLAATMTENTLAVDSNVTQMVDAYTKALEGLNQYDGAKESAAQTVQGIVDGLGEKASSVQEQVNGILAMLAELSSASYTVPGISFNQAVTGGVSTGAQQATEAETSFIEAMAANPVKVQTNVFLDGKQISQNTSSHMADSVRAAERSGYMP